MSKSVREHLEGFHKKSSEHHLALAKAYSKCMKADGVEDHDELHKTLAREHESMSKYHAECAHDLDGDDGDETEKSMRLLAGDRIVNEGVHRISLTGVPRTGAPAMGRVAVGMEKFVSIEEE